MTEKFDAIIIGTGQAGPALAQRMTREGMKTAIIERKLFGGTCVNVGCIPTKALVASARAAEWLRLPSLAFRIPNDACILYAIRSLQTNYPWITIVSPEFFAVRHRPHGGIGISFPSLHPAEKTIR